MVTYIYILLLHDEMTNFFVCYKRISFENMEIKNDSNNF